MAAVVSGTKSGLKISHYAWILAVVWTLVVIGLIVWESAQHLSSMRERALLEARAHFNKDTAFRLWGASHGGVYVPVDERTQPNPYLSHVDERDITSPSGRRLTLMNPAYMLRQMMAEYSTDHGAWGRITSLKPLRPENAPDPWERAALESFDRGNDEVVEFMAIDGEPYLRLMRPMVTQEACLKCHADQGYQVGDIRGGVGISLPLTTMMAEMRHDIIQNTVGLCGLLILGLCGISLAAKSIASSSRRQELAEAARLLDERRSRQALQQSERRLKEAQALAHLGSWRLDPASNQVSGSEELLRIFELSPQEEVSLDELIAVIHPEDREHARSLFARGLGSGEAWSHEHRLVCGDVLKHVVIKGEALTDETGTVSRLAGTVQDVTEHRYTEHALRESEDKFRLAMEATRDGLWDWNVATGSVYYNPAWIKILGEESVPSTYEAWESRIHPDDREQVIASLQAHLEGRTDAWQREHRLLSKDGEWKWVLGRGEVVSRSAAGEPARMIGTMVDISERMQLEQQLRQAQKMEAVGQLAGGVAHDFNNLLQVILGYGEILLSQNQTSPDTRDSLIEIMGAADRARSLVRQLLAFSRRQLLELEDLDLHAVVSKLAKMIRRVIGEHIGFDIHSDPGAAAVRADRGQLEQVLMNLCVNARDAMPEGGTLTITTGSIALDGEQSRSAGLEPGHYAAITVTDTGCGMDETVQQHVFEPFFTSKDKGKGTGLGLSTVLGIVQQHGGSLTLQSAVGQGTKVTIYLPLIEPVTSLTELVVAGPLPKGTETVLLAEDDEHVRRLTTQLLKEAGYTVLVAKNGDEAIRLFDLCCDEIDIAILDVVMPKCNGREVFDHIQEKRPGTPVVFSSGYSSEGIHADFILEQGLKLIQKPYHRATFLKKVRETLDEHAHTGST